ncbi:MAG: oligosaccharide flippase family protein [Elusimicrobiota bacterium]|jgi:O-antigen/teichoic acid export membrane protein|nr:oligosaccharide flippase family protein [Elusimicrobiota bacterium]
MSNQILRLGKETLIYGASTVAARLFNFFLVPFYTYYLVAADYGVAATVFAFMALTNIVYQYGMDQAYLRFAAESDGRDAFSTPFIAVACSAVLLSAAVCLLSPLIAGALGIGARHAYLIQISAAVMALDSLNIVPFAKLRYTHRAWYFVGVRTLSILVNVAGNVLALAYFKAGIAGIFAAGIAASLTSLVLLLPVIKEEFLPRFNTALFARMFKFSWPFIPAGMASIMVNVIDKPLLSHLSGLANVGIYQANFKIGVFMMLVVSMFDQAWRPFFIQRAGEAGHKELFAKILTWFASAAGWVFLSLALLMPAVIQTPVFGKHLISPAYWGGMGIIKPVLAGYFFYGLYINFMVAPVLTKRTGALMWITLAGALASACANIILVPRVGITGAGWAVFISYFMMAALLFAFLQKTYPVKYEYGRLLFIAAVITAALGADRLLGGAPTPAAMGFKILLLLLYPAVVLPVIRK